MIYLSSYITIKITKTIATARKKWVVWINYNTENTEKYYLFPKENTPITTVIV